MHVVVYAKVAIDSKDSDIELQGVYFGGIAANETDAIQICKDCSDSCKIRGSTIFPKILRLVEERSFVQHLDEAEEYFTKLVAQMIETNATLRRGKK